MNEEQARRLVRACQRLLRNAVNVGRMRVQILPQDISAVEDILDDLDVRFLRECDQGEE